jgi:hypothetical protein
MCILWLPVIHVHASFQSSHRYSKKHAIKQTSKHQRMQIQGKRKDIRQDVWLSKYRNTSSSEKLKCPHHLPVSTTVTNNNHMKYLNRMAVEILKHQNFSDQNQTYMSCISTLYTNTIWLGSSVGIATGYVLDGPVGARFFAHVQTGPGAHPASCTMGTKSFPGVKRLGHGADHPPPPSTKVKNE